jgi:hypothetical protein
LFSFGGPVSRYYSALLGRWLVARYYSPFVGRLIVRYCSPFVGRFFIRLFRVSVVLLGMHPVSKRLMYNDKGFTSCSYLAPLVTAFHWKPLSGLNYRFVFDSITENAKINLYCSAFVGRLVARYCSAFVGRLVQESINFRTTKKFFKKLGFLSTINPFSPQIRCTNR